MKKKLLIEGMSCMHCVMHVTEALKGIDGVADTKVDLKSKSAVVELSSDVTDEQFRAAIEDAGYDLAGVEAL